MWDQRYIVQIKKDKLNTRDIKKDRKAKALITIFDGNFIFNWSATGEWVSK